MVESSISFLPLLLKNVYARNVLKRKIELQGKTQNAKIHVY